MPLALEQETFRSVLENLPVGGFLVDRNRQIAFWNASAESLTGYLGQEVIGRHCYDNLLMHCDENHETLCDNSCPLSQSMLAGEHQDRDVFLRHKHGQRVPVRVRTFPIRDESGAIVGSAEFFEERSARSEDARPHRGLEGVTLEEGTLLPDRRSMEAVFTAALEKFAATHKPFGVLFAGIDHLDRLRRSGGFQGVRAVLYAAGQTLSQSTRPCDIVGSWSTGIFAAMIACPSADALHSCAGRVKRLVNLTGVPWWGERLSVSVSMGGSMARDDDTLESITRRAAQALESALAGEGSSISVV